MTAFTVTGADGRLYGIFGTRSDADSCALSGGEQRQVRAAELISSTMVYYDKSDRDELFELRWGEERIWVLAYDHAAAIVDAELYRRESGADVPVRMPDAVFEYRMCRSRALPQEAVEPEAVSLSRLIQPVLEVLCRENRDLCAHAICYLDGIDSEEELEDYERKANSPAYPTADQSFFPSPYEGVEKLSLEKIKELTRGVWSDWLILDYPLTSDELSLVSSLGRISDREEFLFHLFVYERWGCYDCRFPYALYKRLVSGALKPYYDRYRSVRGI